MYSPLLLLATTSWPAGQGRMLHAGEGARASGQEEGKPLSRFPAAGPTREAGNLPTSSPGRAAACFPHPDSRRIAEACVTLLEGGPRHQINEEWRRNKKQKTNRKKKDCNKTGNRGVGQFRPPSQPVTKYFPNILSRPRWPRCWPPSPYGAENKGQREEDEG